MPKALERTFCLVLGFILLAACGDDTSEPAGYTEGLDCPRLELEELEDCTYEDSVHLAFEETVDQFCESKCDKVGEISVGGGVSDIQLFSGVKKADRVEIEDANDLKTLEGLEDLEEVSGLLELGTNFELESISALKSLERVGALEIREHKKLETLDGLQSLQEVSGFHLHIDRNKNLRSINELSSLEYVHQTLRISGNSELPTCQAEALAERVESSRTDIHDNGTGQCDEN